MVENISLLHAICAVLRLEWGKHCKLSKEKQTWKGRLVHATIWYLENIYLGRNQYFVLCDCDDVGVVSMWHKNVFVVPLFFFSHSQLSPFCYCAFKRTLNEIAFDHCSCITWDQIKYCCFNKHLLEYKVIVMVSCRFKSLRETSEILRGRSMNWKPSVKPLRREKLKEGQSRKRSMQRKFSFSRGPTNNWRYILSLLKGSLP